MMVIKKEQPSWAALYLSKNELGLKSAQRKADTERMNFRTVAVFDQRSELVRTIQAKVSPADTADA